MTGNLRERVARAVWNEGVDAAIALVLEEAAQFVRDECHDYDDAYRIAAAIRAMKGEP